MGGSKMEEGLSGCKSYCGVTGLCPVLNTSECPIRLLWQRVEEMEQAAKELVAEAERIVAGK